MQRPDCGDPQPEEAGHPAPASRGSRGRGQLGPAPLVLPAGWPVLTVMLLPPPQPRTQLHRTPDQEAGLSPPPDPVCWRTPSHLPRRCTWREEEPGSPCPGHATSWSKVGLWAPRRGLPEGPTPTLHGPSHLSTVPTSSDPQHTWILGLPGRGLHLGWTEDSCRVTQGHPRDPARAVPHPGGCPPTTGHPDREAQAPEAGGFLGQEQTPRAAPGSTALQGARPQPSWSHLLGPSLTLEAQAPALCA
ncbi:hypothetical protein MC885_015035 [Smutsia gigantea]|nr:hypothetical protein MC885_015035 [Smutsia gigantea]